MFHTNSIVFPSKALPAKTSQVKGKPAWITLVHLLLSTISTFCFGPEKDLITGDII